MNKQLKRELAVWVLVAVVASLLFVAYTGPASGGQVMEQSVQQQMIVVPDADEGDDGGLPIEVWVALISAVATVGAAFIAATVHRKRRG